MLNTIEGKHSNLHQTFILEVTLCRQTFFTRTSFNFASKKLNLEITKTENEAKLKTGAAGALLNLV